MTHEQVATIVNIFRYLLFMTWIVLISLTVFCLISARMVAFKRALKFTINSVTFLIALYFCSTLALIVNTKMLATKADSMEYLNGLIGKYQLNFSLIAVGVVTVLFVINYLWDKKLEKNTNKRDTLILFILDTSILSFGIWLAGQCSYSALIGDIEAHFAH